MLTSLPVERLSVIRDRLSRDGRVVAADLAREFATSEDTIRRDLRDLAAAGHCRRVYGGALPISPASGTLDQREGRDLDAKRALGQTVAGLVRPGQALCIDAGSTNLWVARALADLPLRVFTNAPSIATALDDKSAIEVTLLGGRLDRRSGGTMGARAIRALQGLRFDLYVLGACAADPSLGLAVFDAEEAEWKRAAAEASDTVVAAVTDEKLGTTAPCVVVPRAGIGHLVVASAAAAERWAGLADGPVIHVATNGGRR